MTRKDYVATATILNSFKELIGDQFTFEDLVDEFGDLFANDWAIVVLDPRTGEVAK